MPINRPIQKLLQKQKRINFIILIHKQWWNEVENSASAAA